MVLSYLLLAFILIPIIELMVLVEVHHLIGLEYTIAIVILTGVAGAFLAKTQGMIVMTNIRRDLAEGRMPAPRLIDGVMILIAGVLLITPGLITDIVGFMLLLSPIRASIRAWLRKKVEQKLREGSANMTIWRW